MDLQMLLLFGGGRIRSEAELCALFSAAGLAVTRVIPAPPSPNVVLEGRVVRNRAALGPGLRRDDKAILLI
jgi:hypothetical protein